MTLPVGAAQAAASAGKAGGGGTITYGVEGKTTQFCPYKTQAAISGIMIMQSMYDTITYPTSKGTVVPYLAKSVTPNADLIRDGKTVTFDMKDDRDDPTAASTSDVADALIATLNR